MRVRLQRLGSWLLPLAALVVAQCSSDDGTTLTLGHANVAGWAIYAGSLDAGYDLAEAIAARNLDVVGVSEICESQVQAALDVLDAPYEYVFQQTVQPDALPWSPPPESGCLYGNALIARSELGLAGTRTIELPTEDFTTVHEWDPEEDRWALCSRVKSQTTIAVCTAHLTNLQPVEGARSRQVIALNQVIEDLRGPDEPAVLIGDFNARIGDADLAPLASWANASGNRGVMHVLVKDLDPVDRGTVDVGRADHDLVWASVRMPDAEEVAR